MRYCHYRRRRLPSSSLIGRDHLAMPYQPGLPVRFVAAGRKIQTDDSKMFDIKRWPGRTGSERHRIDSGSSESQLRWNRINPPPNENIPLLPVIITFTREIRNKYGTTLMKLSNSPPLERQLAPYRPFNAPLFIKNRKYSPHRRIGFPVPGEIAPRSTIFCLIPRPVKASSLILLLSVWRRPLAWYP